MENHKLVEKLRNQANISYEEAESALKNTSWDILDAMLYLEAKGKTQKPSASIYYTNEHKEDYSYNEIVTYKEQKNNYNNARRGNTFGGIFEIVCKAIDTGNNIFFEIKREKTTVLKLPITVIILLIIFTFWIVIPLFIVGLFFDMEFSLSGNWETVKKINNIFNQISVNIRRIKEEIKKGFRNG